MQILEESFSYCHKQREYISKAASSLVSDLFAQNMSSKIKTASSQFYLLRNAMFIPHKAMILKPKRFI